MSQLGLRLWTGARRATLLALVLTAVAACGGGGDSNSTADSGQQPNSPPPASPPPAATGTATLQWAAPETATDGSPITTLAGYRIYYGTDVAQMTNMIEVSNPGLLTYVVDGLTPATYYFAVTAIDAHGGESERSNAGRKIIS